MMRFNKKSIYPLHQPSIYISVLIQTTLHIFKTIDHAKICNEIDGVF